ncbi:MAG TPA: ATP-binding protein [Bacillota bacterium]
MAAALVALAVAWRVWGPPPWIPLLPLLALGVTVGEVRALRLPAGEAVSTGAVMGLTAVWLMPPTGAALVEVLGWILAGFYRRRLTRTTWFNAAQTALAALSAGAVFHLAGGSPGIAPFGRPALAYLLAASAFLLVNSGLVAVGIALQRGERVLPAVATVYRSHLGRGLLFAAVSTVVAAGVMDYGWPALVGYMILIRLLERLLVWMRAQELGCLEDELSQLLAAPTVESRLAERLVRSAEAFGRDLELPEQEQRDLRFAALIRGAALEDAAARRGLRRAVAMAGINRILAGRRFLAERGLPREGIAREAIARGARILAILEAFDDLINAHGPGSPVGLRAALQALESERGRTLDPDLTGRFIDFVLQHEDEVQEWLGHSPSGRHDRLRQLASSLREVLAQDERPGRGTAPGAALVSARLADGALARLHMLLSETLGVDDTYARIAEILAHAVGEPCWVASYNAWGAFRLEAGWGVLPESPATLAGNPGPMLRAVTRLGCAQAQVDTGQSPWSELLPGGRWNLVVVPLVARGRVIGVLCAGRRVPGRFTAGEPELLEAVAGAAALALDNARLREEMRQRLAEVSSLKRFTDQVLDRLPVAVIAFGTDGRLRLINRIARRLFADLGLDADRMERLPLRQWVRLDRRWAPLQLALSGDGAVDGRWEWHDPALVLEGAGGTRVFDVHVTPVRAMNGTVVAAVGVAREVTEHHRLERQVREAERLAAVGQLAAGAAHEIRNPLTAIKGFLQLMHEDLPDEDDNLALVLAEIDRIERLVDDLLLMARPAPLQTAPCDLNRLIGKVAALLQAQARSYGIVVETALAPDLPVIQADSRQLRQVMFNLARNAMEAMSAGGILRFETLPEGVDDPPAVTVRVVDTGHGISEVDRARIFEPFFTTKAGGTGLGLSVVYAIIRNHGGSIDVASGEGRGTTFSIHLPVNGPQGVETTVVRGPFAADQPEVTQP